VTVAGHGYLALRDRAVALLAAGSSASDEELVAHIYGAHAPPALHSRLLAPLVDDPRLARQPDGRWSLATSDSAPTTSAFTTLALATTAAHPSRGRIVRVAALHVSAGEVVERFSATCNPGVRVPRYVLDRIGADAEILEDLPSFAAVLDDFLLFLADRPVCAQEAPHAWSFIDAEARRLARTLAAPPLLDFASFVVRALDRRAKPTLAVVARQLGVSYTRIEQPDEEARVLALVVPRLPPAGNAGAPAPAAATKPLRRRATAREQPDRPGIYVMLDAKQQPLYVGKARHLRNRVESYVQRPIGATRRLEGLAEAVEQVTSQPCATDLEALVLEAREIGRLQPRFNTARQQRAPRTWLRLPPQPSSRPGKRQLAPARLELVTSLSDDPAAQYLGPFRNEAAAAHAHWLGREVFELDRARRTAAFGHYVELLDGAWRFLAGAAIDDALQRVRARHAEAVAAHDHAAVRRWSQVLAAVREYSPADLLLAADPRVSRFVVLRPTQPGLEAFLIDRAIFVGWSELDVLDPDLDAFAKRVLEPTAPRTRPEDADVVLRWLGSQHPPARLVYLPPSADAVRCLASAVSALLQELAPVHDEVIE
jgi:DNA polymerase III epsilon subunit-like protein